MILAAQEKTEGNNGCGNGSGENEGKNGGSGNEEG